MMRRLLPEVIAAPAVALLLSACAAGQPHVLDIDEFDRQSPTFNTPLADRDGVEVCYNGLATPEADVTAVAAEACGRFDKLAVFEGDGYGACPLLTPVAAHFDCVARSGTVRSD